MKIKAYIFTFFICTSSFAQVFPGAVGFGADWTFDTSGLEVRVVNNLKNLGFDSFREAYETPLTTNTIIVFNGLSGYITIDSDLNAVTNGHHLYVAGQTSENGIWVRAIGYSGPTLTFNGGDSNIIIRGMVFSSGDDGNSANGDPIRFFAGAEDIVIDNSSFIFGVDENIDVTGGSYITFQNVIVANCLNGSTSAKPMRIGNGSSNISIYNTVFSKGYQRNPLWGGTSAGNNHELVNYIVNARGIIGTDLNNTSIMNVNIINGYYQNDLSPTNHTLTNRYNLVTDSFTRLYVRNIIDQNKRTSTSAPQWNIVGDSDSGSTGYMTFPAPTSRQVLTPFDFPLKDEPFLSVAELKDKLTALDGTGAGTFNPVQNEIDILNDVKDGSSGFINYVADAGGYKPITSSALINDTDHDGIPDSEEATWGNDTFEYVNWLVSGGGAIDPIEPVDPPSESLRKRNSIFGILNY